MYTAEEFKRQYKASNQTDLFKAKAVMDIIHTVQERGDDALIDYARKFDGVELDSDRLEVPIVEMRKAYNELDSELRDALEEAYKQIYTYQESIKWSTMPKSERYQNIQPLTKIGIYVPGGKASYPSTVLMTATLANVAGVKETIIVTPPQPGGINQTTLAACFIAKVDHVYQAGGAQGIAAMAYGTETIPKVDKIVGPGNQYVALAKKLVYGDVGIDSIAGPSEIVLVVDETANEEWVALDVLAQAEHDEMARTFLISTNKEKLDAIEAEIDKQKMNQSRLSIINGSLKDHHYPILTRGKRETIEIVNLIAGEHVSIQTEDAEEYIPKIKTAGALFIGPYSPEAIGDYVAGPSHVLPTNGNARFANGLTVNDFLRTNSVIQLKKETFQQMAPFGMRIAKEEELQAHHDSLAIRWKEEEK
ncbi:histidinol dehydrogenase [Carnobacterium funditum]|uniref:histidinol dehydrogenase n=1 Tax=Carnobacterium funditum TaxID=2752 RepID=UPI000B175389|nr:histidinol dehydrogenase [Carnobacterium funditum]